MDEDLLLSDLHFLSFDIVRFFSIDLIIVFHDAPQFLHHPCGCIAATAMLLPAVLLICFIILLLLFSYINIESLTYSINRLQR